MLGKTAFITEIIEKKKISIKNKKNFFLMMPPGVQIIYLQYLKCRSQKFPFFGISGILGFTK
jgi:hypothetical protein